MAISLSGLRQSNVAKVFVYSAIHVLFGISIGVVGPSLPDFATEMGTTPERLNFVFIFRGGGSVGFAFLAGIVFDKFPGHPLLGFATAAMCFTMGIVPFTASVSQWLWASLFALVGMGASLIDVGANSMLAWMYGNKLGTSVQLVNFCFGFGSVVAPLVVTQATNLTGSMHSAYYLIAILSVPCVLLTIWLNSPTHPSQAYQRFPNDDDATEEADVPLPRSSKDPVELKAITSARVSGIGVEAVAAAIDIRADVIRASLELQSKPLRPSDLLAGATQTADVELDTHKKRVPLRMIVLLSVMLFVYYGFVVSFGSWLYAYALHLDLAGRDTGPYLSSVFWGTITLTRLILVPFASRLKPFTLLLMNMSATLVLTVVLVATAASPIALWVNTALLGIAVASVFAAGFSLPSWLGYAITAKDTMWIVIGVAVGELAVPAGIGFLFDRIGYWVLPYCLLGLAAAQLSVLLLLYGLEVRPVMAIAARLHAV
eukprot:TRINITY_DN5043_c0_g1_i1.p1 TRINITY_DN5043_c0_g1~~TRINITY_DN5043_c0_g1_i1.p1  ORF type:complete len:486 (+),score=92.36 TRINITY_DN5043_c0_g1_i1:45-1502(+)